MRVVIAPDSFKECASAMEVAESIAEGWRCARPGDELRLVPMADGGEGTVDALIAGTRGERVSVTVTGPLGDPVTAVYGMLGDRTTAVMEMAAASGLALAPPQRRDPRVASTYGTGELMRHALDRGATRIILGIGGSATNDAGAGMAQALGYSLTDSNGRELSRGGAALTRLHRIDQTSVHPGLAKCEVLVACDVTNPLCGDRGASRVYGPQKGASAEVVEELDAALRHFGAEIERQLGVAVMELAGGGAAGGLGAGLAAFARGALRPGVDVVAQACGLESLAQKADLVITGEGKLDHQSANGKTPVGVARIAKRHGKPVIAIAGSLGEGHASLSEHGIDAAFSICSYPMPLSEAMARARELLAEVSESVARLWNAAQ